MEIKYLYLNGKFQPVSSPHIPVTTHAFNYGTAAFEGMRAYYRSNEKTWVLFRPDRHFQRLKKSMAILGMDFNLNLDAFIGIIVKLLKKNNVKSDLYVRPIVYLDAQGVGLRKPSGYSVAVYLHELPVTPPRSLSACFVSQRRPIDRSYAAKITGNYVLSYLAYREAVAKGYETGILLSSNGLISEAWAMNLFFSDNGKLFTPSVACGALEGVTRDSIIHIARKLLGLKVYEGKYRPGRLQTADEIFLTGTGSGINSISRLEKRKLPTGKKHQLARELWQVYSDIVLGKNTSFQEWLVLIN